MGYERNDRGYGRDANRSDAYRDGSYRTDPYRNDARYDRGNPQDRGFFERAGDEVRSWFGDEEAERRRRYDEQLDERYDRETGRGDGRSYAGYGSSNYSSASYPRYDRSNSPDADRSGYARDPYASRYPESGTNTGYRASGDRDWRDRESRALYGRDDRPNRQNDPHGYHSWREQQISSFDRDYDEYRRENQSRFASEFSAWRENRQTQRQSLRQAKEHQEVVGSDGQHVGTVDHVRGDRILLTKTDKDAGGHHHSIPSSWIRSVDDKVHISKTADEAHKAWRDEENNGGLFGTSGRDGQGDIDRGAADLNRSFSGTY